MLSVCIDLFGVLWTSWICGLLSVLNTGKFPTFISSSISLLVWIHLASCAPTTHREKSIPWVASAWVPKGTTWSKPESKNTGAQPSLNLKQSCLAESSLDQLNYSYSWPRDLCEELVFLVKGTESKREKEKVYNDWLETWTEILGSAAMERQSRKNWAGRHGVWSQVQAVVAQTCSGWASFLTSSSSPTSGKPSLTVLSAPSAQDSFLQIEFLWHLS